MIWFRLRISDERMRLYVLAFLGSQNGQALLRLDKTGSVIDHIDGSQVVEQQIPVLEKLIDAVVDLMGDATRLRERARLGIAEAQARFNDYMGKLPELQAEQRVDVACQGTRCSCRCRISSPRGPGGPLRLSSHEGRARPRHRRRDKASRTLQNRLCWPGERSADLVWPPDPSSPSSGAEVHRTERSNRPGPIPVACALYRVSSGRPCGAEAWCTGHDYAGQAGLVGERTCGPGRG